MAQHRVFLQWRDRDPVVDRLKNGGRAFRDEEILVSRIPVKDEVIRLHREEGRSARVNFVEWVEIDHLMEPVLFLDH